MDTGKSMNISAKNSGVSPSVSVLMPCYNAEKYLAEALASILNQTYTDFEVIAIDDCSSDRTPEILRHFSEQDKRVKVYRNSENLKLIKTLNRGVTLCSGKYIARMDSDDIALPERLEKEVAFLDEHADYGIVSCQFSTFRDGSAKLYPYQNPTKFEELQAYLLFKSGICHPASMIRKTVFTELGLRFEEQYLHVEDYALWSKALYLTKLGNVGGKPLLLYRVHKSQVSSLYEALQTHNKREVFKIHCQHLNLDESDEGLEIYSSVAAADPLYSSFDFLKKCEQFMLLLTNINTVKPFCSSIFLENMLALHWIRLCANSRIGLKVLKLCRKSPFYKKKYYTKRDELILFFKCLFKIKYKKSWIYNVIFR
jgi:glycosyltransferase involved in cell wall biosynthesis